MTDSVVDSRFRYVCPYGCKEGIFTTEQDPPPRCDCAQSMILQGNNQEFVGPESLMVSGNRMRIVKIGLGLVAIPAIITIVLLIRHLIGL